MTIVEFSGGRITHDYLVRKHSKDSLAHEYMDLLRAWEAMQQRAVKVEQQRDAMGRVLEDLASRLGVTEHDPGQLADAVEALKRERDTLAEALRDIHECAHDMSTGPTEPDGYWQLRQWASDALAQLEDEDDR